MTLLELRTRLNAVIEENERRDWQDRNNLPVKVLVAEFGKLRRNGKRSYKQEFVTLTGIDASMYGIKGEYYAVLRSEKPLPD